MGKEVSPDDINVTEVQSQILDATGGAVGLNTYDVGNKVYLSRVEHYDRHIRKALDEFGLDFEEDGDNEFFLVEK